MLFSLASQKWCAKLIPGVYDRNCYLRVLLVCLYYCIDSFRRFDKQGRRLGSTTVSYPCYCTLYLVGVSIDSRRRSNLSVESTTAEKTLGSARKRIAGRRGSIAKNVLAFPIFFQCRHLLRQMCPCRRCVRFVRFVDGKSLQRAVGNLLQLLDRSSSDNMQFLPGKKR